MIDGSPGAEPAGRPDAWLVTDERAELIVAIRRMVTRKSLVPHAGSFRKAGMLVECRSVVHTPSHLRVSHSRGRPDSCLGAGVLRVYRWARGTDLMFAEGAAWSRPIVFAGHVGGHLDVHAVARSAKRARIGLFRPAEVLGRASRKEARRRGSLLL